MREGGWWGVRLGEGGYEDRYDTQKEEVGRREVYVYIVYIYIYDIGLSSIQQ